MNEMAFITNGFPKTCLWVKKKNLSIKVGFVNVFMLLASMFFFGCPVLISTVEGDQ